MLTHPLRRRHYHEPRENVKGDVTQAIGEIEGR